VICEGDIGLVLGSIIRDRGLWKGGSSSYLGRGG